MAKGQMMKIKGEKNLIFTNSTNSTCLENQHLDLWFLSNLELKSYSSGGKYALMKATSFFLASPRFHTSSLKNVATALLPSINSIFVKGLQSHCISIA